MDSNDDMLMDREVKCEVCRVMTVEDLRVVPMEELEEFEAEILKVYSKIGAIDKDCIDVPVDYDNRKTLGYCLIQYTTEQECQVAKQMTAEFKLERLPIFEDSTPGENLRKWLPDARDDGVLCSDSSFEETIQNVVMDEKASDSDIEFLCDNANRVNLEPVFKHTENVPAWMDTNDDIKMLFFPQLISRGREEKRKVSHVVMVEDLRVVPMDESEELEAEILKVYSKTGAIDKDCIHVPVDYVDGKTLGYCLIQYTNEQECEVAKQMTAEFKLERLPIFEDSTPGENLRKWLSDARDDGVLYDDSSSEETIQNVVMDEKASDSDTEFLCDDANRVNPEPVFKHTENVPAWMDTNDDIKMLFFPQLISRGREEKRKVSHVVMVEDLRVVPMDESEELEAEILKVYSKTGAIDKDCIHVPVDYVDGKTLGYCLIQYTNEQECEQAKQKTAEFKLQRLPIFEDSTPGENLRKWLSDARDDGVLCDDSSSEVP